jgi:hypothetical protein
LKWKALTVPRFGIPTHKLIASNAKWRNPILPAYVVIDALDHWLERWHDLDASRSSADHGHTLALELDAAVPLRGVHLKTLKGLESRNLGPFPTVEKPCR